MRQCGAFKDALWVIEATGMTTKLGMMAGYASIGGIPEYPDNARWAPLDPEGVYEPIYNRFAHIGVTLTGEPTSFELVFMDEVMIHLNYADLQTLGADYLMTCQTYPEQIGSVHFQLLNETRYFRFYRLKYGA